MKKLITFALVAAVAILLAYLFAPGDSVRGIELGRTLLYSNQSAWERYQYRRLISNVVDGDRNALAELVDFPCGDGEGCYDHGATFVKILMKIGDYRFSEMAGTLDKRQKSQLKSLMDTGFEDYESSRKAYPLAADALSPSREGDSGVSHP